MADKPDLIGLSKEVNDRSPDITASLHTIALFKGKIDEGFVILRASFDHQCL